MDNHPLVDTWNINNRINLYLLDNIEPEQLKTPLTKGKTVGNQFAHIHSVRLMWLKASAPELMEGLEKVEDADPAALRDALIGSGEAISKLIERGIETGKIKNFKPHAHGFVAYLVAHESFHRAQAELALRQAGTPLSDKVAYGMWEWGTR